MPAAASKAGLIAVETGGWRFAGWGSRRIAAGLTDRGTSVASLLRALGDPRTAEAEQVHGASLALLGAAPGTARMIAGCDALITGLAKVALLVRSADCLPIFFADPSRGVVGLAHAGWRGLASSLPARMVSAFRDGYHVRAEELYVAIGPAIHACCYEVGPDFSERFGRFVQERAGRRTCDLIGVAREQLQRCGVRPERLTDSERCTACETQHWFSLRREGPSTGRLTSVIMVRS